MYTQFIFKSGSNSYIATTHENLFKMICKYYLSQFDCKSFSVNGRREWRGAKTYEDKKVILQSFAVDWQLKNPDMSYTWHDLTEWGAFFEDYGRKFGLLREFRENGIL